MVVYARYEYVRENGHVESGQAFRFSDIDP